MPGQGQVSQSQRSARFVLCGRCPHTLAGMTGHQATKDLDDVGTQGDRTRQDEGRRLHTRVQKGASIPTSRGPLWSHRRIRRCVGRTCIMAHSCSIRMGRLRARRLHDVHCLLVGLGQDFQERGSDGRLIVPEVPRRRFFDGHVVACHEHVRILQAARNARRLLELLQKAGLTSSFANGRKALRNSP